MRSKSIQGQFKENSTRVKVLPTPRRCGLDVDLLQEEALIIHKDSSQGGGLISKRRGYKEQSSLVSIKYFANLPNELDEGYL